MDRDTRFAVLQFGGGLALLALGLLLLFYAPSNLATGAMMIGGTLTGSALLGFGARRLAYSPEERAEMDRKSRIETEDERNVRIREKSGWAAQRVMTFLLLGCEVLVALLWPENKTLFNVVLWLFIISNFLPAILKWFYARRL